MTEEQLKLGMVELGLALKPEDVTLDYGHESYSLLMVSVSPDRKAVYVGGWSGETFSEIIPEWEGSMFWKDLRKGHDIFFVEKHSVNGVEGLTKMSLPWNFVWVEAIQIFDALREEAVLLADEWFHLLLNPLRHSLKIMEQEKFLHVWRRIPQ